MTAAQHKLYLSTWQAAAKALGWNTVAGIADALAAHLRGVVWHSPELNRLLTSIYQAATLSAQARACGLIPDAVRNPGGLPDLAAGLAADVKLTADDLRHACSAIAIGRHVSSKQLTNAEFDRVLAVLRLLSCPDNLNNLIALENASDAGERRRHVHLIQTVEAAYWKRICADKFGHCDLERLPLDQLRQLSLTIRMRTQKRRALAA